MVPLIETNEPRVIDSNIDIFIGSTMYLVPYNVIDKSIYIGSTTRLVPYHASDKCIFIGTTTRVIPYHAKE